MILHKLISRVLALRYKTSDCNSKANRESHLRLFSVQNKTIPVSNRHAFEIGHEGLVYWYKAVRVHLPNN